MTDDFDRDPVADAVRASLHEHAKQAPAGDMLAERIIHAADRQPRPEHRSGRRGWRTWALPLIAAGAVAGVVAAVVGIENYHPDASKAPLAGASATAPVHRDTSAAAKPGVPTPSTRVESTNSVPIDTSDLHGVRVIDLTFAGTDDGWALASADCIHGSGRCPALLRTTNGTKWTSMPGTPFNVATAGGCAYPCVSHIRFANDRVGYAYGPSALLMTLDGGASWAKQGGGAQFLETLDQNVIRVLSTGSACPGPCGIGVETADIGGSIWTAADLGRSKDASAGDLSFARGGSDAYLLVTGQVAGGAERATSTLYRSADDGRSWRPGGEPCPQLQGREVDSRAVAGAPSGRVSVLCTVRQAPNRSFVATSDNGGTSFEAQAGTIPATDSDDLSGDPSTVLIAAGRAQEAAAGLSRSTDGGASWHRVAGPDLGVSFVGFESPTVGRVVTDGGRSIWTTTNAGKTWTEKVFG